MDPAAPALAFSPASLSVLNLSLGFLMFAVSLFIERGDFVVLRERPRGLVTGLTLQWLVLPLLAIGLAMLLQPDPGIALGMLLVAACPGGNVSNYLNLVARANVALSVGLTTISTVAAAFTTPFIFFTGARLLSGGLSLPALAVPLSAMLQSVLVLIAVPLALGQTLKHFAPAFALRIRKPVRLAAGLVLMGFIVVSLLRQSGSIGASIGAVGSLIVLHNAATLAVAYGVAALFRAQEADRRAVTLESGIHNAGLGLVLTFNFFGGSGPMALMVAGWGVWHLVTGGALALWWSRRPPA